MSSKISATGAAISRLAVTIRTDSSELVTSSSKHATTDRSALDARSCAGCSFPPVAWMAGMSSRVGSFRRGRIFGGKLGSP